jgi:hypothetical protein
MLLFTNLCTDCLSERAAFQEGESFPGTMTTQDEFAFLKAILMLELFPGPEPSKVTKSKSRRKDFAPGNANGCSGTPSESTLYWS